MIEHDAANGISTDTGIDAPAARGIAADRTEPCSHSQRRLWFLDRLSPGSAAYHDVRILSIFGALDVPRLRRALDATVARHEMLRTRFTSVDGEPRQCIDDALPSRIEVTDLAGMPGEDRAAAVATALDIEAEHPFDLERGPLLRVTLFRLAPTEHLFVRVWHHILADGWSADLFERELAAAYDAPARDASPSPIPALQYRDYARWQRAHLDESAMREHLRYWTTQLRGNVPLALSLDRPRPARPSDRGDVLVVPLPSALAKGLRLLARIEGATPFMAFLAAFATLLYRISDIDDVTIGTPIAGRSRVQFESMLGFFANTLAMRTDLSGAPTFRQVLRRVKETALAAYAHQDIPFERVVESIAPARDADRNPLFQVAFALEPAREGPPPIGGMQVTRVPFRDRHAKFDLMLALRERDDTIDGHWEFATDRFDRETIDRMAAAYEALLFGIVSDADQPIDVLPLLSVRERDRVLDVWSGAGDAHVAAESLVTLFESQASTSAERPAVCGPSGTLTYGELNASANRLARELTDRGVTAGSVVGIALERDVPMIVAVLATLKAGAAYLPIDPELPRERIAFMLDDAGATAVVTEQRFAARLPVEGVLVAVVDRDTYRIAARPATNLPAHADEPALAYVMYTSGSTGRPKGVAIRRASVVALVRETNYVELSPDDVVAQLSHAAFDAATFEIFGALLNGGRLVILHRDAALSAATFARARSDHGITVAFLTTSLFNTLARERPDCFAGLRSLLFGGEAADRDAVRRVLASDAPGRLVNAYGPTETTTFATFHVVQPDDATRSIPIGRPIRGAEVYVLDPRGELVAPGMLGELYIGGTGVAAGYVGGADASNARFVALPWRAGTRVFRTGDRVRWQAGRLSFVGRNDDQVKIRGFRIEPAEVRSALEQHASVIACHVMARKQTSGDLGLTAYVVASGPADSAAVTLELRRYLATRLPVYLLPSTIVPLARMPLLPSGKVDVSALPDPTAPSASNAQPHVAPRTDVERHLCDVWTELLGVEDIGIDDDFFELGGHSLLAARLFARIETRFSVRLPLRALFETPTVRALAARASSPDAAG